MMICFEVLKSASVVYILQLC